MISFCESVWAGSASPWHLRVLSAVGRKVGGGIDTPSLCGHVQPPNGWDLEAEVTAGHLGHVCGKCVAEAKRQGISVPS